MNGNNLVTCAITNKKIKIHDATSVGIIRPKILMLIKQRYPNLQSNQYISRDELKRFRKEYLERLLSAERGELSSLDHEVVRSMVEHETIAKNVDTEFEHKLSFGDRLSDNIATFGGSWRFIILFGAVLVVWISINTALLLSKPFDPYPFILLNLVLSCLAAIQAPVIMMSQNRKESRDRLRAEHDYKINLKAELEIRTLHEKIDNLMQNQWDRLLEIQQLQMDMMEDKDAQEKDSAKRKKPGKTGR